MKKKSRTSAPRKRWRQVSIHEVLTSWFLSEPKNPHNQKLSKKDYANKAYPSIVQAYGLFLRHLPHCDWFLVDLKRPEELMVLQVINERSWNHKTPKSRPVGILTQTDSIPKPHAIRVNALAATRGLHKLLNKRVVLFGHHRDDFFSIIDGNHRLLAYARAISHKNAAWRPFKAYVGISLGPCRWHGDDVSWTERPPRSANEKRFVLNIW